MNSKYYAHLGIVTSCKKNKNIYFLKHFLTLNIRGKPPPPLQKNKEIVKEGSQFLRETMDLYVQLQQAPT